MSIAKKILSKVGITTPTVATDPNKKIGCGALLLSTYLDRDSLATQPELLRQLPPTGDKRVLLFQRGYGAPTHPGSLGGAGGIFEADKDASLAEAAKRETFEEANIIFTPEEPPLTQASLPDRDVIYFIGTWTIGDGGIVHKDNEAVGHVWLTGNQALQMNLSFHYRNAIEKLIKQGRL